MDLSFAEILVGNWRRKTTGALDVAAESVRTRIYLVDGIPVFAEGGAINDALGRMLLRQGRITQEQFERALEHMRTSVSKQGTARMGEVLVELGLLAPAEVFEALQAQVREKILTCFQWERVDQEFRAGATVQDPRVVLNQLVVERLVLDGVTRHYDAARCDAVLGPHLDAQVQLKEPAAQLAARLHVGGREQRFLLEIDGTRPTRLLRDGSRLDARQADQLLVALWFLGCVDFKAAAAVARPPTPTPGPRKVSDILAAMPSSAPKPPPARAPQPTPARPIPAVRAPDSTPARPVAAVRAVQPTPVFPVVVPPPPDKPAPTDPRLAKLEADAAFQSGRKALHQNLLGAALRDFKRACDLQPDEVEYQLHRSWTVFLAEKDEKKRNEAKERSRAFAIKMVKQQSTHALAHKILGRLLKLDGQLEKARYHFVQATENDPSDTESAWEMRVIDKSASKQDKKKPKPAIKGDEEDE